MIGQIPPVVREAVDAIWEDTQGDRPVLEVRQQDGRNRCVVAQHIALRVAILRPEELVEIGDANGAPADLPFFGCPGCPG